MPHRRKTEPPATPSEHRKRRRRTKAARTAPQAEPIPAQGESTLELTPPEPVAEAPEATGQDATLAEAERLLVEKYPHINIKPGSLQPAGRRPEFGNKRTLVILCSTCSKERVLATSDLFHVSHCRDCARAVKRAAKKEEQ
jgi:hypothetical protein